MEEENTDEPSPQLTGIVIITLPPPDNTSLGKTITAYTISDHQRSTHQPPQLGRQPPPTRSDEAPPQLVAHNHAPRSLSSFRSFIRNSPKTVLPILGISLIALYLWVSVSRETIFQLRDDYGNNDENQRKNKSQHAFLFPLYQKPRRINGELGDFELKLGRFMSSGSRRVSKKLDDTMEGGKINTKSVFTASKIDATSVIPIGGNIHPDGLYYTYMYLGNPPRPYFLDMDTGSDLTWIQCDAPCASCAKGAHPFYKPLKANILPPKDSYCTEIRRNQLLKDHDSHYQCDYEIEYADQSSSMGVLARDELYLNIANGSLAKSKVVFGCAYDQQGILLNSLGKTDGILGLSSAKISLPSQLASKGIIKNVVGHCLATEAIGGGYLFLGDDLVPHKQMTWVPMLQSYDSNSYQTKMVKVSYGSKEIGLGSGSGQGRLVFDTGSSYSYFTEQAYDNLVTMLSDISSESLVRDLSDTSLPICWRAKSPIRSVKDVRQIFKPLNLHFGSKWWIVPTKLQIPPEGYLVTNSKGNVCLGILNGRKVHDGSTFILGDISLRGLLFVYDNVYSKIGWVRSDCATPRSFGTHSMF